MNRVICLIVCFISSVGYSAVIIGSKKFSESVILGCLLELYLEEVKDLDVETRYNLGGTNVAFEALKSGAITVYPEYSGTGYVSILKNGDGESNPDIVFDYVKKQFLEQFDIVWSPTLGFNNTYVLAARSDHPNLKNVSTISDLPDDLSSFKIAVDHEFMQRSDGLRGLINHYQLNLDPSDVISMDAGLVYSSVKSKQLDIVMAYSTDGRIKAFDLKKIRDDKNFFPPYYVSFIAKSETLEEHPELKEAFQFFASYISEEDMLEMNYFADKLKQEPIDIARNYLISRGVIGGEQKKMETLNFWSTLKANKWYLVGVIYEHLYISFVSLLIAGLISIPFGIWLTRTPRIVPSSFFVINTFQTIPSLALLGFLIPLVGIGLIPTLIALILYSLLPMVRNTYSGIKSVNPILVEVAKGMGMTSMQILVKVEIPIAMPIILAGVRTAGVIVVGTATLAALIGGGGLGDPIFRGISTVNSHLILLGAIPAALLAIFIDRILGVLEKKLVSEGIR